MTNQMSTNRRYSVKSFMKKKRSMKDTNRAPDPQKIILRSDELYNGPFSRMMIFCFSLTEIEFW